MTPSEMKEMVDRTKRITEKQMGFSNASWTGSSRIAYSVSASANGIIANAWQMTFEICERLDRLIELREVGRD